MLKFAISASAGSARAGIIETTHGRIETPAFIPVATKATVKSLTPEQVQAAGAQAVLANAYHLYLQPGTDTIRNAGGLSKFMNWPGPTFTDSGGFQAFSLGAGLSKIDDNGVTFKSVIDGSTHRFTPEISIDIQRAIGADIIFAFDECASPVAAYEYQKIAMERTHRWAERCLKRFNSTFDPAPRSPLVVSPAKNSAPRSPLGVFPSFRLASSSKKGKPSRLLGAADADSSNTTSLFGIIQGGRHEDLRRESARIIGSMSIDSKSFDGFGIGGSFDKSDIGTAVKWVCRELPEDKPRHLLGIGEPEDLILGIDNGIDTFDCVAPTRIARNGAAYSSEGRINLLNARFVRDFGPIDRKCSCYTCANYTRAYVAHLFRAKEMLAATLVSIHNLFFIVNLVGRARQAIINGEWDAFLRTASERYGEKN